MRERAASVAVRSRSEAVVSWSALSIGKVGGTTFALCHTQGNKECAAGGKIPVQRETSLYTLPLRSLQIQNRKSWIYFARKKTIIHVNFLCACLSAKNIC